MQLPIMVEDLKGKVAVVTGAGGIICSELSRALAAAGAKVALLDRSLEKAEAAAEELRKEPIRNISNSATRTTTKSKRSSTSATKAFSLYSTSTISARLCPPRYSRAT